MPPYAQAAKTTLLELCRKWPDSTQAHDIWDALVNDQSHIQVNAYAGTGKTFTASEGTRPIVAAGPSAQSIIYLCFNKSIQLEASKKMPQQVATKTFNGAGFGSCLNQWPFLRNNPNAVNADRTWQMLPDNMPPTTKRLICRMVDLCKNTLSATDRESLLDLATKYDVDLFDDAGDDALNTVLQWVPDILEQSKTPTSTSGINFNDQIWLPVVWGLPIKTYDIVIVDEAQDLNRARISLALMIAGSRGRVVFIGDRRQAIYGFSGSDHTAMDNMADALANTPRGLVTLPLSVTRRCPQLVTALAQEIVPNFVCLPTASLGSVCLGTHYLTLTSGSIDAPKTRSCDVGAVETGSQRLLTTRIAYASTTETFVDLGVDLQEKVMSVTIPGSCPNPDPQRGDMVLCRLNAPLVQLAYKLIKANMPVKIQGRDLGTNLANLIKKLVNTQASTDELLHKLQQHKDKETGKINRSSSNNPTRLETQLQALNDKVTCIQALCEGLNTTQEVLSRISVLFSDVEKGAIDNFVLLSSVHKAKGLEARVVRIINPEKLGVLGHLPWQQEQEQNLKYVAITRSLDTLHIH